MNTQKTDLTNHGNEELSMYFLNDEGLYNRLINASDFNELEEIADQFFIYDDEQLEDLQLTFETEQLED